MQLAFNPFIQSLMTSINSYLKESVATFRDTTVSVWQPVIPTDCPSEKTVNIFLPSLSKKTFVFSLNFKENTISLGC